MNGDMEDIAEAAASKAVHEVFSNLGVDTNDQGSLNEFRSDLVFVRRQRKRSETIMGRFVLIAVGAVTLAFLSLMWDAIKVKLGQG